MGNTPYSDIKQKIVFDILEKFPNTSIKALSRIVYAEASEFFNSSEHARTYIRFYKGKLGVRHRKTAKITKYYIK